MKSKGRSGGTLVVGGSFGSMSGGQSGKSGAVNQMLISLIFGAGSTVVVTSGVASGGFSGGRISSCGDSDDVPVPGTLGLLLVGTLGVPLD